MLQAGYDIHIMTIALSQPFSAESCGHPDTDVSLLKLKPFRHHTDYRVFFSIENQVPPQHARFACVTPLPKCVTDDGYLVSTLLVFISREVAAERGLNPE